MKSSQNGEKGGLGRTVDKKKRDRKHGCNKQDCNRIPVTLTRVSVSPSTTRTV